MRNHLPRGVEKAVPSVCGDNIKEGWADDLSIA